MYKELVISIIIIILIISLDVWTQNYTKNTVNETIESLSELEEDMKDNNLSNDEIVNKTNATYNKWMEYHDKLAFYIEHNELEKVETNFIAGKSFIESKQYDLATSELEKTIFILDHITDKYSFNFTNIF